MPTGVAPGQTGGVAPTVGATAGAASTEGEGPGAVRPRTLKSEINGATVTGPHDAHDDADDEGAALPGHEPAVAHVATDPRRDAGVAAGRWPA